MEVRRNKSYIKLFDTFDDIVVTQQKPMESVETVFSGVRLPDDDIKITLSEYDRVSKDVWTAHHAADYRRKTFSLVLLPQVEVMFDKILEGSAYWNERLHNDSPYS